MKLSNQLELFEIWQTIEENPKYEVSSHGNVRHRTTLYVLQPWPNENKDGKIYWRVTLSLGRGKNLKRYVHRLVGKAFCGLQNDEEAHHVDGNTANNCAWNIRPISKSSHNHYHNLPLGERKSYDQLREQMEQEAPF